MGGPGSGPKAKPNAIKRLEGSWRVNEREPKAEIGEPKKPEWLGRAGQAEWKRLAPILVRMGVLTEVDGTALTAYCRLVDQASRIRVALSKVKQPAGELAVSLQREERDIYRQLHQYIAHFGLSPATRTKIVAQPTTPVTRSDNPWAA